MTDRSFMGDHLQVGKLKLRSPGQTTSRGLLIKTWNFKSPELAMEVGLAQLN